MGIFDSLAAATTVEIETALSPPIRVRVSDQLADTGPGFMTRLLRPRVTVRAGNAELLRVEPAGAPDPELRALLITALGVAIALALVQLTNR